ncbi:RNA polymerase II-associated factor 1 [Acrasis kona]|uniref:RNA polymerase II-associated factor 1 n=1 Tax=Acrasis kona TaxID=1008807 RepID=A0AAW2ZKT2_9EUKA
MNRGPLPGLNGSQQKYNNKPSSSSTAPPINKKSNAPASVAQPASATPTSQLLVRRTEAHPLYKSKSNFVCHNIKFQSALPTIPLDAKLLSYPIDPQRFVPYKTTTLERNHKYDLLTETDLGIHINLIDPNAYKVPINPELDPEDEALLSNENEENKISKHSEIVAAAGTQHKTWLRKTEYMGGVVVEEPSSSAPIIQNDVKERKGPVTVEEEADEIMTSVEKSFDFVNAMDEEFSQYKSSPSTTTLKHLKHVSKPGLKPVGVYSVLPDERLWSNLYTQVSFDNDPLEHASVPHFTELRKQEGNKVYRGTIIKQSGGSQKVGGSSVNYLRPRNIQSNFVDDGITDQDHVRDYQWVREYIVGVDGNVPNTQRRVQDDRYFFMTMDDDQAQANYNQLRMKFNLKKKKAKVREDYQQEQDDDDEKNQSRYILGNRDFYERELKVQNERRDELVPEDALDEDDQDLMDAIRAKK